MKFVVPLGNNINVGKLMMYMKSYFLHALIGMGILCSSTVNSQTLEQAKALFKNNKYEEALPVFEKQYKASPRNASYNHWYGVCLYEMGKKQEARKPLEFAASKKIQEAYRYYGDLLFDNYEFEEAAQQYEKYLTVNKNDSIAQLYNDRIERAATAARFVERVIDVEIIDSTIINLNKFQQQFKAVTLEDHVMPLSDVFETDGKYQDAFMFVNERDNFRVFPFKGPMGGMDFYSQDKLSNGNWSDRKLLPQEVNSNQDENFPFILSDGVTMYFGSKGHNSIGGYDIFVTRYNAEDGTYFQAENIGMPFNSPANDYLYAVDEQNGMGWFITDRNQTTGKAIIYTFIYNESRETVRDKTDDEKRSLARIDRIKSTWKKSDYSSLLQDTKNERQQIQEDRERKQSEAFRFYIDENRVYTQLSDFKSVDARGFFQQYVAKTEEVKALEQELENWRTIYAKDKQNRTDQLKKKILTLESKYEAVVNMPHELENKARQAELKMK